MSKPLRVLLIEDSAEDVELVRKELQLGGYDTIIERVETAEAFMAALDNQTWNIIISDYRISHLDGIAALKLLRKKDLYLPFIFVSGTSGEDAAVAAMKAGANDYVMKSNLERLVPALVQELRDSEVRRDANRQLYEHVLNNEERFRQLAENITEVFWMTSPEKNEMLYVSPGYEKIWGRTCNSLYERPTNWIDAIHPEDRERVEKSAMANQVSGTYDESYRIVRPDGTIRWIRDRAFPVKDASGQVYRITGIAEDITERKEAEELIQHMAFYDSLTELPNRNMLYNRLVKAIRIADGEGKSFALLLMDLNHFKEINDTMGHHRGDLLLKELGLRLKRVLFEPDVVARLGGDEFAVLLRTLAHNDDYLVAVRKIIRALEMPFVIEDIPIVVETSLGIALYPDHGTDADMLLRKADIAMYVAKEHGSGYTLYTPELNRYTDPQRLALMAQLRQAIDENELILHYQPKITLKNQILLGVEALVRWNHPKRGMVPPDEFIGLAERTGLIYPLTSWVLQTAITQSGLWRQRNLTVPVSVNLSARNLLDSKLPIQITQLLQVNSVTPESFIVEITESAIMADPLRARDILLEIHNFGIKISIDDFGIGYSSLRYLQKLPVDRIKIDKSFVMHMMQNDSDKMIVRSTIGLAHNLGLEVIAEGVENVAIYNQLVEWGCDIAQGYYISKPLPAEELMNWFDKSFRRFKKN